MKPSISIAFLSWLICRKIDPVFQFNSNSHLERRTGSYLDDQPGSFPCTGLAYGPYEATQLLARDPNLALLNIENYVWYALVSLFPKHVFICNA